MSNHLSIMSTGEKGIVSKNVLRYYMLPTLKTNRYLEHKTLPPNVYNKSMLQTETAEYVLICC